MWAVRGLCCVLDGSVTASFTEVSGVRGNAWTILSRTLAGISIKRDDDRNRCRSPSRKGSVCERLRVASSANRFHWSYSGAAWVASVRLLPLLLPPRWVGCRKRSRCCCRRRRRVGAFRPKIPPLRVPLLVLFAGVGIALYNMADEDIVVWVEGERRKAHERLVGWVCGCHWYITSHQRRLLRLDFFADLHEDQVGLQGFAHASFV
jgi:hypothetical protein